MHGLINRALRGFVLAHDGAAAWQRVMSVIDVPPEDFGLFRVTEAARTSELIRSIALELDRSLADFCEDWGHWLVTAPEHAVIRRLLRFGGKDFIEFVHSIEDLPDRAALAVPGLQLPPLDVRDHGSGNFTIQIGIGIPGTDHALLGVLRAMADDYHALVLMTHLGERGTAALMSLRVVGQMDDQLLDIDLIAVD
ncbi:MAG: heme NO-binding domain-containing protein [Deltaproteobacteria bacterium]